MRDSPSPVLAAADRHTGLVESNTQRQTLLVLDQTWLQTHGGWLVQRYGMNSLFGFKGDELSAVNQAGFACDSS